MIVGPDRFVLATAFLAAATCPAAAQEKITLRLAESLPAGHVIHELVAKPFMELVTKATNGQVTFQHFPAEQLGKAKDMAQLTVAGVADVSYIVPSYSSDKYPLTAVAELPGIFETECQGSLAFYKLSHNGGILETKEFGPNQLRPLVTIALPAYQIQLATVRDVKTAKDLEGLKIRTTGGAMDLMMRSIGGVPVRMAAPEIYELLTRGTLDGLIFSYQSSVSYDFGKIVKSGTEGLNFGTAIFTYSIGETKFKQYPLTFGWRSRIAYDQSAAQQKGHVYLDYHGTFSGELSATLWDLYQPNRPTYVEGSALYGSLIPASVGDWLAELQNTNAVAVRERNLVRIAEAVSYESVLTVPFLKYYMVVGASPKVTGYQPHPLFFWPQVWNQVDLK